FIHLCLETVLLAFIVGAGWLILRSLYLRGLIRDREGNPFTANTVLIHNSNTGELSSLAVQTVLTILLVALLAASEMKFQCLMGVAVASFLASFIVQFPAMFPTATWGWYWLPPLL